MSAYIQEGFFILTLAGLAGVLHLQLKAYRAGIWQNTVGRLEQAIAINTNKAS